MTDPELDALLDQTFVDRDLSRGERRALGALVRDSRDPEGLRARLRSRAYAAAHRQLATAPAKVVLEWLEDVDKALTSAEVTAAPISRSDAVFAPHMDVVGRVIHQIEAVRARLDAAIFTITDDRLSRALIAAKLRGVAVRLLADNDKAHDLGSDIERLANAGIAVRVDRTEVHMHHKFAIFDGRVLLTGSFNWTRAASEENHENVLFTEDPHLVRAYQGEFERCWQLGI